MISNEHRKKLHKAIDLILNVLNYPCKEEETAKRLEDVAVMIMDVVDSLEGS